LLTIFTYVTNICHIYWGFSFINHISHIYITYTQSYLSMPFTLQNVKSTESMQQQHRKTCMLQQLAFYRTCLLSSTYYAFTNMWTYTLAFWQTFQSRLHFTPKYFSINVPRRKIYFLWNHNISTTSKKINTSTVQYNIHTKIPCCSQNSLCSAS
jgi:hypothetical protein